MTAAATAVAVSDRRTMVAYAAAAAVAAHDGAVAATAWVTWVRCHNRMEIPPSG